MDYKLGRRYFATVNWVMLVIIFLIAIASFFFKVFIGVILILGIALYLFLVFYFRPNDEAIDSIYQEQSDSILEQGYKKLGLMEKHVNLREPVVLSGPSFEGLRYDPAIKKGNDKVVRSSNYQVSVFYFGKEQVYLYQQTFSIIDREQNEVIDSYFYQDIVSIATSSEVTSYYNELLRRDEFVNLDTVILHTTGSSAIKSSVQDVNKVSETIYEMKDLLGMKKRQH